MALYKPRPRQDRVGAGDSLELSGVNRGARSIVPFLHLPVGGHRGRSGTTGWGFQLLRLIGFSALALLSAMAAAQPSPQDQAIARFHALDAQVAELKKHFLSLNRDLIYLEEEELISPGAQLVVFVALTDNRPRDMDSLQVRIEVDGKVVANHMYSRSELDALGRGGMHRIHLGSVPVGKHLVTAYFNGSSDGKSFDHQASAEVSKDWQRRFLQIQLTPKPGAAPKVAFREW